MSRKPLPRANLPINSKSSAEAAGFCLTANLTSVKMTFFTCACRAAAATAIRWSANRRECYKTWKMALSRGWKRETFTASPSKTLMVRGTQGQQKNCAPICARSVCRNKNEHHEVREGHEGFGYLSFRTSRPACSPSKTMLRGSGTLTLPSPAEAGEGNKAEADPLAHSDGRGLG